MANNNTPYIVGAVKDAMSHAGAPQATLDKISDVDVFNSFLRSLPQNYSRDIDLATAGFENIVSVGSQILADEDVTNAWISNLIDRIGMVLFDEISLENPLRVFKKGLMPNGKIIQEIAVDTATGYRFNPQIAETELYKRVKPNVANLVHVADRNMTYPATFQDQYLNDAFTSFDQLDQFVTGLIRSMINGNEDDLFFDTKLLISKAASTGNVPFMSYDPSQIKNLQKQLIKTVAGFNINNRDFNRAYGPNKPGIKSRTSPQDLVVIMDIDTKANLDVDFWAQIFNPKKADMDIRIVVIDQFEDIWQYTQDTTVTSAMINVDAGSDPYVDPREFKVGDVIKAGSFARAGAPGATKIFDASGVHFWLGDEAAIQIWDRRKPKIKTTENPQGMYVQAFLQVRQIISYSQIAQSVIGVEEGSAALQVLQNQAKNTNATPAETNA